MTERSTGIWVCAILFAIGGVLGILVGLALLLLGAAMLGIGSIDTEMIAWMMRIFAGMIGILAVIIMIIGVVSLAVAYGIWNMKKWAKIAGIILAIIGLLWFPIGTVIALIILYLLLIDKSTKDLFIK